MSEKRKVVIWGCDPDAEVLSDHTREEAIESFLDGRDLWEGTIQVYGYARMIPERGDWAVDNVIEALMEGTWEELHDPENGPEITEGMIEAAKVFVAAMAKELHVWACEIITSEDVDVAEWIKKNRPDWKEKK